MKVFSPSLNKSLSNFVSKVILSRQITSNIFLLFLVCFIDFSSLILKQSIISNVIEKSPLSKGI